MRQIPRDPGLDNTLKLLSEGYCYVLNRCRSLGSDIFETRLLLQNTICMLGEEAARIFYDSDKFLRHGAMPRRTQKTLLGVGGVQSLDPPEHTHRKALFVSSLMTQARIDALVHMTEAHWHDAFSRWQGMARVVLFDEVQEIFCRSVCAWAGVPLPENEVGRRTADFAAMIESGTKIGPAYWLGRFARVRGNRWAADLVEKVRRQQLQPPAESALYAVAMYRGPEGKLLPAKIAAVELINILRPTVAVARFVAFAALALHEHASSRERLIQASAAEADACLEAFVQEVRRYYPFFPLLAAKVRQDFAWEGYFFPKGRKVLLDLYGTNHDPRSWHDPEKFHPERFATSKINEFNLIPNGGGNYRLHHRCPGEWITLALMKQAVHVLVHALEYRVPLQDLKVSLAKIPTLPASRFVITDISLRRA